MALVHVQEESASEQIFMAGTSKTLSIDTEGNAIDVRQGANPDGKTMGISLGYRSPLVGEVVDSGYFPYRHKYGNLSDRNFGLMKGMIETFEGPIIMHNAKHDIAALANLGIKVPRKRIFDTMLGFHWINEEYHSKALDAVSRFYGGDPKNRSEAMQGIIDKVGWGFVPPEIMHEYAANDAKITLEAYENIWPTFVAEGYDGWLWERELHFMDLIMRMEALGVGVNTDICEEQIFIGEFKTAEIRDILGLNPASTKDLEKLLIDDMGLPVFFWTPGGKPSFKKAAMDEYEAILANRNDETAKLVLEFRGWQKAVSSFYRAYLDLLSPDGNLRANYKLHGARTPRVSCEKPNLQQIPRASKRPWNGAMKKSFKARPGYSLWEADYGQLEMRLAAIYSNDEALVHLFNNGINLFDDMQSRMPRWDRDNLKTNTYATLYGAGAHKIHLILNIPEEDARQMRTDFYSAYPGLRRVQGRAGSLARSRGYVKCWTGRRRHFNDPEAGTHKAFNAIIQGGGAEIVKSAMLILDEAIDWDECRMVLQIHDSVVFEIANGYEDKWLPLIQEIMENVSSFNDNFSLVPFPVDIHRFGGDKWVRSN